MAGEFYFDDGLYVKQEWRDDGWLWFRIFYSDSDKANEIETNQRANRSSNRIDADG